MSPTRDSNSSKPKLVVALDVAELDEALALVDRIGDAVGWFKIGKQLFTAAGPEAVRSVHRRGRKVFLDLKFHDIPNTVAQAVRAAAALGAEMVDVHASGGPSMLSAAARAAAESGVLLVGVTVLTSLDAAELAAVGIQDPPEAQVLRLARLCREHGLDGVVCSPREIRAVRAACGDDFQLVVPGIRPAGTAANDQKRIMTPAAAAAAGAGYLVIGRPITRAPDPARAAREILAGL